MEQKLSIVKNLRDKMQGAINSLNHSLNSLRAGRANTTLLDPIKVDAYGRQTLINQIGSISAPDAKTLAIQIWDKELVSHVEKAILNSSLGLIPNTEGQILKLNLPNLSEKRRKELVKKASEYSEKTKISVRNLRRKGLDSFKKQEKDRVIAKDELKNYSQEVQKVTDEFIDIVDNILKNKSKEIMSI